MPIFIDAHVHIYPQFALQKFFAAAWDNFSLAAARLRNVGEIHFVLALAEGNGYDMFARLSEEAEPYREGGLGSVCDSTFSIHCSAERHSLLLRRGKDCMILVNGRQLVSTEKIEVLSLGSDLVVADERLPLSQLVATVIKGGGIAVLPWGFGKWLGTRGAHLAKLLLSPPCGPFFLGDNGNRPRLWPRPQLLNEMLQLGNFLLSGSDPLPLASQVCRPASTGTLILHDHLSLATPAASLLELLSTQSIQSETFGHQVGTIRAVSDQLLLRLEH